MFHNCLKIFRSYNNNTLSIFMIHKVIPPTWGSNSTLKSRVARSTDGAGQVSPDSIFNMCSLLMEKNCSISIIFKSVSYIYSLPRVNKTWQMSIYVSFFFKSIYLTCLLPNSNSRNHTPWWKNESVPCNEIASPLPNC